jgi:hypothetical protein
VPDTHPAGLDPAHIVGICTRATEGRRSLAVGTRDGISVSLPSQRTARRARAALVRVGYEVSAAATGRGRDIVVTGWDPAGLDSRLAAMRTVLHQLDDNPALTARMVIKRFRELPGVTPSPHLDSELLDQARTGLRDWVDLRSGIHAPRDPAVAPTNVGVALRLRAAGILEEAIDDLIERQLRAAGHALALFSSLRERMGNSRAQAAAIHRACATVHRSGSAAQDSTPLLGDTGGLAGPGASAATVLAADWRGKARKLAGRESPGPFTSATSGPDMPAPGRPAVPQLPTSRPHRSR